MTDFKLIKNEYINDVKSECFYYRHNSGAKLIFLKNDDNNRVFTVAFRTEPENNSGASHIVEHCTLCGSQNFRLKDPFNILDKGTIHTYLNAITYQDKTVYPVAGTVEQDFMMMVQVYLDAVFKPLMLENEGIFQQEGWHCDKNGINGVVYNEMKGVFSLPHRALKHKLQAKLYNGTSYQYYSGGIPEYIPNLTYEKFIDFYKRKYQPSNAVFYLYGNLDIEKYFELIDGYIKNYMPEKFTINPKIDTDKAYVGFNMENNNKNYLMAMFNTGKVYDYRKNMALKILTQALFNNENLGLKKKLLDLGAVVKGEFDDTRYFSDLTVYVEDSHSSIGDFKEILKDFAINGSISSEAIESAENELKFYISEEDYGYKPKGLYYGLDILNGFLYNNEDFEPIKYSELFKAVEKFDYMSLYKELLENGVYGEINTALAVDKQQEIDKLINNQALIDFQKQQDSQEELIKISTISLSEISRDIYRLNSVVENNIIFTPIESDIIYVDFVFNVGCLSQNLIEYIGLYRYVAQRINVELAEKIKFYMGELNFSFSTFNKGNSYMPALILRGKFLKENLEQAMDCIKELIFSVDFSDLDKLSALVKEQRQIMNKSLVANGNFFAINYALSCCNERYKFSEMITGIDYLEFLTNDNSLENIKINLTKIKAEVFNKADCIISYGCSLKDKDIILKNIVDIYNQLSDKISDNINSVNINTEKAIYINSLVNYNALIGEIPEFNGYYKVIKQIITSYLWDNIRIKGGAYGGSCDFYRSGYFKLSSYRDPRVSETFEDFYKISDWLRKIKLSQKEINRYITGAISIMDMPVKNNTKTVMALNNYLSGLTDERLILERQQVLETNLSHIKNFSTGINIENGLKCSVGNEKNISDSKLYNKFIKLLRYNR